MFSHIRTQIFIIKPSRFPGSDMPLLLSVTPFTVTEAFRHKIVLRTMAHLSLEQTVHALASGRNLLWTFLPEWTFL